MTSVAIVTSVGVPIFMFVLFLMVVVRLIRRPPQVALPTHEHIGIWEKRDNGDQVRNCLTCNFEEKVVASGINCEEGIHDWGKWEQCAIKLQDSTTGKHIRDQYGQERACQKCGFHVKEWIRAADKR